MGEITRHHGIIGRALAAERIVQGAGLKFVCAAGNRSATPRRCITPDERRRNASGRTYWRYGSKRRSTFRTYAFRCRKALRYLRRRCRRNRLSCGRSGHAMDMVKPCAFSQEVNAGHVAFGAGPNFAPYSARRRSTSDGNSANGLYPVSAVDKTSFECRFACCRGTLQAASCIWSSISAEIRGPACRDHWLERRASGRVLPARATVLSGCDRGCHPAGPPSA